MLTITSSGASSEIYLPYTIFRAQSPTQDSVDDERFNTQYYASAFYPDKEVSIDWIFTTAHFLNKKQKNNMVCHHSND